MFQTHMVIIIKPRGAGRKHGVVGRTGQFGEHYYLKTLTGGQGEKGIVTSSPLGHLRCTRVAQHVKTSKESLRKDITVPQCCLTITSFTSNKIFIGLFKKG